MKKTFVCIMSCLIICSFFGCSKEEDNLKKFKYKTTAEYNKEDVFLKYESKSIIIKSEQNIIIKQKITNESDMKLTGLVLKITYLDKDDNPIYDKSTKKIYRTNPILINETREFIIAANFDNAINTESISVVITDVITEKELTVLKEPIPNSSLFTFYNSEEMTEFADNFYIDKPIELKYFKANYISTSTTDKNTITEVFEKMKGITIGDESNIRVTDSEIVYTFIMSDKREFTVSFESTSSLSYYNGVYKVLNDNGLFGIEIK